MTDECNSRLTGPGILKLVRPDRCLCPLCSNPRATFYCSNCVRFGDFVHSNPIRFERLAEKRLRLKSLSLEISALSEKIRRKLPFTDAIRLSVENKRLADLRIRYLKGLVRDKRDKCRNLKEISVRIGSMNTKRRIRLPEFSCRTNKIGECLRSFRRRVDGEGERVRELQKALAVARVNRLNELTNLIFPVERILRRINKDEEEDHDEVVDILADAMRTSFVHGRWITANLDNSAEINYQIVNPTLPSTGDYSSFYHYGGDDQVVVVGPCSSTPDSSEVSIIAGLSYAVQLVNLMALFADVVLPKKMLLSDFLMVSPTTNEYRFARRVARLNYNVVYLISAIDDEIIIDNPLRALQNIFSLISYLKEFPQSRLSFFNYRRIKCPETLMNHTQKIALEVSKLTPEEESSDSEDDEPSDFKEIDEDDWESVSEQDPSLLHTPMPSVASNIVSSIWRGLAGGSSGGSSAF